MMSEDPHLPEHGDEATPEVPNGPVLPSNPETGQTSLDQVCREIRNLAELFRQRLLYDATKETALTRLCVELDNSKKHADFQRHRPVFIDLILFFDRLESIRATGDGSANDPTAGMFAALASLSEELVEILRRNDVELISVQGPYFDPTWQRVVAVELTQTPDQDNHIVRVLRRGFHCFGQVVRPEEVVVFRLVGNGSSRPK